MTFISTVIVMMDLVVGVLHNRSIFLALIVHSPGRFLFYLLEFTVLKTELMLYL